MGWYDKLFEAESYQLANGKVVSQKFTRLPLIIVLLLIGISISVWVTGFSLVTLVTNFVGFWQILASMWPPNLAYFSQVWPPLWGSVGFADCHFSGAQRDESSTSQFSGAFYFNRCANDSDIGGRFDCDLYFRVGHLCRHRGDFPF